jgi:hypothetical protein
MLSLDFGKTSILWSSCVYCPRAKSRDPRISLKLIYIGIVYFQSSAIRIILSFTKHILTIQNHTPFLTRFLTVNYRLSRHRPPPIPVSMYRFLFPPFCLPAKKIQIFVIFHFVFCCPHTFPALMNDLIAFALIQLRSHVYKLFLVSICVNN